MLLNLSYYSEEPIHNQIVNQILLRLFEEDKLPGDQIDSIGTISRQHHIGKTSVSRAFSKLETLGVINTNDNENYFVSDISTRALKTLIDRNYYTSQSISEYEVYKTEIIAAKQIQNGLLPKNLPSNKHIDVAAYSTLSDEVGGDFYDFFEIEKMKYGVLIGDASGKGFPAAMLISQIQAIIKSDLSQNRSVGQDVQLINSYLNTYSSAKYFVTLFYGILNLNDEKLTYINAGHNFPILHSDNTDIEQLKTTGPALGLIKNANFKENVTSIDSNSTLFLFTDGLSERMDNENNMFGESRIINILRNSKHEKASPLIEEVKSDLSCFAKGVDDSDDTTFMAVKIKTQNLEERQ